MSWRRLCPAHSVNYEEYGFRDSPIIDRIAQVAAMKEAYNWEVKWKNHGGIGARRVTVPASWASQRAINSDQQRRLKRDVVTRAQGCNSAHQQSENGGAGRRPNRSNYGLRQAVTPVNW